MSSFLCWNSSGGIANFEILFALASLKLTIYRELGFDLLEDSAGNITKALIRSREKRDVNTVIVDTPQADFYRVNMMWEMCS